MKPKPATCTSSLCGWLHYKCWARTESPHLEIRITVLSLNLNSNCQWTVSLEFHHWPLSLSTWKKMFSGSHAVLHLHKANKLEKTRLVQMSDFDASGASVGQVLWPTLAADILIQTLKELDIMFHENRLCTQCHLIHVNMLNQQISHVGSKGLTQSAVLAQGIIVWLLSSTAYHKVFQWIVIT